MSWIENVRAEFPQLKRELRGRPIVYLDSAATALKPKAVIAAVEKAMSQQAANVHRGAHILSDEATDIFESVREKACKFVGAELKNEIIFTRGTTEGLNLIASSLGDLILKPGDEIVLSQMEHHSNIVPWQMAAQKHQAKVLFTPVQDDGSLDFEAFQKLLSPKTKIVSLVHLSNALGTLNPLAKFFEAARKVGAKTVADAAQSAAIMALDVKSLNADFLVFSGHKVLGPTGIGVLYGRYEFLEKMPPYQGGGSMINQVTEEGVSFLSPPHRFEAGTPAIAEVFGLGAALDFLTGLGFQAVKEHERKLMSQVESALNGLDGLKRYGQAPERSHAFSFLLGKNHPGDVGAILDEQGIAVRAGHHCCQPLMRRFGIAGTVRASFSVYTNESDIERFVTGVKKAKELLG